MNLSKTQPEILLFLGIKTKIRGFYCLRVPCSLLRPEPERLQLRLIHA